MPSEYGGGGRWSYFRIQIPPDILMSFSWYVAEFYHHGRKYFVLKLKMVVFVILLTKITQNAGNEFHFLSKWTKGSYSYLIYKKIFFNLDQRCFSFPSPLSSATNISIGDVTFRYQSLFGRIRLIHETWQQSSAHIHSQRNYSNACRYR